jgi:hypothetical protein
MSEAAWMVEILAFVLACVRAALRSRRDLVVENALLRHQFAVLTRPTRQRPRMRTRDTLVGFTYSAAGHHAALRSYSWTKPPRRSRRTISPTADTG